MRRANTVLTCTITGFNPRTRKGCDIYTITLCYDMLCFNPRTRKGCDDNCRYGQVIEPVSIHAPVKDATYVRKEL
mgnify:CR=1 FL=1